jgi:hypothetical protein
LDDVKPAKDKGPVRPFLVPGIMLSLRSVWGEAQVGPARPAADAPYPLAFAPSRLFGAEALQVVPEFPGH